jgi:hypothetical protein
MKIGGVREAEYGSKSRSKESEGHSRQWESLEAVVCWIWLAQTCKNNCAFFFQLLSQ